MQTTTTPQEIDRYTSGQCHAFAEALAEIADGELVAWQYDDGSGHAMTLLPDGRFTDITGTYTLEDMLAEGWLATDLHHYRWATDLEEMGWEFPDVDEARPVAERIAATIN